MATGIADGRGTVNEEGLAFYDRLIDELIANQIEPIVTIYHWDLPQALQEEYGGWESRQIIPDFTAYAALLFERFGDRVRHWVTLNEQNIFITHGYLTAEHPPAVMDAKRTYQANHMANLANASAIKLFHEKGYQGGIGPSFAYSPTYALDTDPVNQIAADDAEQLNADLWLDVYAWGRYPKLILNYWAREGLLPDITAADQALLQDPLARPDFMGLNYYQTTTVTANPLVGGVGLTKQNTSGKKGTSQASGVPGLFKTADNPYMQQTDWDWNIDPEGLRMALRRIESRYSLPVLITENGLGAYDRLDGAGEVHDDYRIAFLKAHIQAIQEAITDGVTVIGYTTWSFTDLLSWTNGYQKRYGFVYVDRDETDEKELNRYPKDSFYWYQRVIRSNGQQLN